MEDPREKRLRLLIAEEMMIRLPEKELGQLDYRLFRGYLTIYLRDTLHAPAAFGPKGTMLVNIGWSVALVVEWLEKVGARKLKNVKRDKKAGLPLYD